MTNQDTHEVQIMHSGDPYFTVAKSFLTRRGAEEFAVVLGAASQRPVRINSPLAP